MLTYYYRFIDNIYTSAKTGHNIEEAFLKLCENIHKHNLASVTKYVGWLDDADTNQNEVSHADDYISLQSIYENGSFRLSRQAHTLKNESILSAGGKHKKCQW